MKEIVVFFVFIFVIGVFFDVKYIVFYMLKCKFGYWDNYFFIFVYVVDVVNEIYLWYVWFFSYINISKNIWKIFSLVCY